MIKKILILLVIAIPVGLACYIFYLNNDPATVYFTKTRTWQSPLSIILIATFFFGVFVSTVFAFYSGAKRYIADWQRERGEQQHKEHIELIREGSKFLELGETDSARSKFEKIVKQDSSNILAWLLLSKTLEDANQLNAAVETLDGARRTNPDSLEILMRAAKLYEKINNPTAAYDNYSLILEHYPQNSIARSGIVANARKLGRFDEAIENLHALIKKTKDENQEQKLQYLLAEIELEKCKLVIADKAKYEEELKALLKRHRDFPDALKELAKLEQNQGNNDKAANNLVKAFSKSGDLGYLDKAAQLWLSEDKPDKAVSIVKNAISSRKECPKANLYLLYLYTELGMLEPAKDIAAKLETSKIKSDEDLALVQFLKANLRNKEGKAGEANQDLLNLVSSQKILPGFIKIKQVSYTNGHVTNPKDVGPAPHLSTP